MKNNESSEDLSLQVRCPVCRKIIIKNEEFYGECPHVMLTYSDLVGEFGHIDDSLIDVAEEMEQKVAERYRREDEGDDVGDLEYITIPGLMLEFAEQFNNQYVLLSHFTEGLACGPASNTDYILFKITDKKATATKTKQSNKSNRK